MNIPINKDVEKDYRNEIMKGFTWAEAGCMALGIAVVIVVAVGAWLLFHVSPRYGCYIGLPIAFPIILLGFKKFQGLSAFAYLKEILYEKRTGILSYDAMEAPDETRTWTLVKRDIYMEEEEDFED